jgi:hypothetical protein
MTVKVITYFDTLMAKAAELGRAKKSGNKEWIKRAQDDHDAYHRACLDCDEMRTEIPHETV